MKNTVELNITKVVMGADPLSYDLKEAVKQHLQKNGIEVKDLTPTDDVDYFSVGEEVGKQVASGEYKRGFIFCGTGMGVNIVANKYQGVYSALCESIETARLSRIINNANILAMGGIIITPYLGKQMADTFMKTPFSKGFSEAEPGFLTQALSGVKTTEAKINRFNQIHTN